MKECFIRIPFYYFSIDRMEYFRLKYSWIMFAHAFYLQKLPDLAEGAQRLMGSSS